MSLYGSGRREGISSVFLIVALVLVVQVLGSVQALGLAVDLSLASTASIVPGIAGLLFYRFLRAQGRSRYTAFLTGVAYALSPWLLSIAIAPREQLAAALAPLALEAVSRCDRASQRRLWLPWTGPCLAVPFLAGSTLIASFTMVLCACLLVRTVTCGDRSDATPPLRGILLAVALAIISATSLWTIDPLAPWLVSAVPVTCAMLQAHHVAPSGLDLAAVLRVPGPCLLLFAMLGILRRQRHTGIVNWLIVAGCGVVPTALSILLPGGAWASAAWHDMGPLPAVAWWLFLLGIAVLGAAGLDDFLDLPLRRRTALPWLLAFVVLAAPMIAAFGSNAPTLEWPLTATMLAMVLLLPLWRRMGILRFKNVLAVATVVALAAPALQVLPVDGGVLLGAVPAGETFHGGTGNAGSYEPPRWPYAGGALVLLCSGLWSLFALWRSITAKPVPTRAKAAITKKARPDHRS